MNKFSVPSDFDISTIDYYKQLNNEYENSKVVETYGNVTKENIIESGRPKSVLPDVDFKQLENYISYSLKSKINFNYTLNATTLNNKEFIEDEVENIIRFLKRLNDAGVTSLTIAMPSMIELVNKSFNCFKIKASTLCQITSANKALMFKRLGVDRIVVDESINRKFNKLKNIREQFGPDVELIANVICHQDCIYRMFHYNQMSSISLSEGNEISESYYPHRCLLQRYNNVSNLMKLSWIRPEDLKYYNNIGITNFKLQGRQAVKTKGHLKTIKHYFNQKYDGDLMDLLNMYDPLNSFRIFIKNSDLDGFIKPFVRDEYDFCENNCEKCGYCQKYAERIIDMSHANDIIQKTKEFYNKFDPYSDQVQIVGERVGGNYIESEIDDRINTELNDFNL
ncbi:MAG: hypothetical protein A2X13_06035 [Bacteroidetes bacterium GWC2_33_15]|nr:MAG: hypothetical protein A2X10_03725 [Bacteroidetes bacterium GWA2_33_15]OFX51783.1 MAG: hypothetical protein A2X13_06035 [Bacteroidetes bacterium GWC2_33_15]OFX66845.1 MAG: hypothetical protein A2X15_09090 [Bacteroidetes bacterium GWB2_32_14]OFX67103.1 MAG: hypothetical protein A2X14_10595 [Bacteroidetes bacterium GWD2_33_33]HAN17194.1 hypothetical protein [Bacteroidales bacterium]